MKKTFEVRLVVDILAVDVERLIIAALSGGSDYWIEYYKRNIPLGSAFKGNSACLVLEFDGSLSVLELEETTPVTLDLDAVERGLKLMAEKYPHHMRNFINEDDDAETADVFLQCCLFGDIRYS